MPFVGNEISRLLHSVIGVGANIKGMEGDHMVFAWPIQRRLKQKSMTSENVLSQKKHLRKCEGK